MVTDAADIECHVLMLSGLYQNSLDFCLIAYNTPCISLYDIIVSIKEFHCFFDGPQTIRPDFSLLM